MELVLIPDGILKLMSLLLYSARNITVLNNGRGMRGNIAVTCADTSSQRRTKSGPPMSY